MVFFSMNFECWLLKCLCSMFLCQKMLLLLLNIHCHESHRTNMTGFSCTGFNPRDCTMKCSYNNIFFYTYWSIRLPMNAVNPMNHWYLSSVLARLCSKVGQCQIKCSAFSSVSLQNLHLLLSTSPNL